MPQNVVSAYKTVWKYAALQLFITIHSVNNICMVPIYVSVRIGIILPVPKIVSGKEQV